eukprot:CAMPEP_0184185934 /NCGR_PEP_ID=MMETSP0976-20121227/166_1 /TAXON_ID=483370 /ORGANISM="non described non described, Strain CCMP2097" /LENGTH=521 /DNA_ID=CAMNT_0026490215 /DNA_START=195 /DNA_END=1757 /DNA_ORIENTATION=-
MFEELRHPFNGSFKVRPGRWKRVLGRRTAVLRNLFADASAGSERFEPRLLRRRRPGSDSRAVEKHRGSEEAKVRFAAGRRKTEDPFRGPEKRFRGNAVRISDPKWHTIQSAALRKEAARKGAVPQVREVRWGAFESQWSGAVQFVRLSLEQCSTNATVPTSSIISAFGGHCAPCESGHRPRQGCPFPLRPRLGASEPRSNCAHPATVPARGGEALKRIGRLTGPLPLHSRQHRMASLGVWSFKLCPFGKPARAQRPRSGRRESSVPEAALWEPYSAFREWEPYSAFAPTDSTVWHPLEFGPSSCAPLENLPGRKGHGPDVEDPKSASTCKQKRLLHSAAKRCMRRNPERPVPRDVSAFPGAVPGSLSPAALSRGISRTLSGDLFFEERLLWHSSGGRSNGRLTGVVGGRGTQWPSHGRFALGARRGQDERFCGVVEVRRRDARAAAQGGRPELRHDVPRAGEADRGPRPQAEHGVPIHAAPHQLAVALQALASLRGLDRPSRADGPSRRPARGDGRRAPVV